MTTHKDIQTGIVRGTRNLFWAAARNKDGKLKFGYCRSNKNEAIRRAIEAAGR